MMKLFFIEIDVGDYKCLSRSLMSSTSPPLVGERIVLRAFVDNFYVEFFLPEEEVKLFEFFAFTDLSIVPARRKLVGLSSPNFLLDFRKLFSWFKESGPLS